MALGQLGQQHRHQPPGRGADHADPGVARHRLAQGPDVGDQGVELAHDPVGPGHHDLAVGGQPARRRGRRGCSPARARAGPRGPRCWTGRCPDGRRPTRTTRAPPPPPAPADAGVPSLFTIVEICISCLTDRADPSQWSAETTGSGRPPPFLSSRSKGTGSPSGPFAASGPGPAWRTPAPGSPGDAVQQAAVWSRHGDGPLAEDPSPQRQRVGS